MSEEITGLALQLGQPALWRVRHVEQAAERSSATPTLVLIGHKQSRVHSVLLKEACVELLEQREHGRRVASGKSVRTLRLESASEIAAELARAILTASGRSSRPKVMFIEPRAQAVSSDPQVSFVETLRDALSFLDQVVGTGCVPQSAPPEVDEGEPLQLARQRRDQLLEEEKWFDAPQVHVRQGGKAGAQGVNNTASRARRGGELLGAWNGREYLHPQFQFDPRTGRLMPEMKELLQLLPQDRSGWRQTFWLFQKHGQLDGQRPADIFQKDPAAVIRAARSDFVLDDERW